MVDYVEAIKKPFSDVKTLVLGSVIAAIPLLGLYVGGYALNSASWELKGKKQLPSLGDDVSGNIMKLVMGLIIGIVYALPAFVLFFIGGGAVLLGAFGAGATQDPSVFINALTSGGPMLLVGAILAVIAGFISPIAVMSYLSKGTLSAAFAFGEVIRKAFTGTYIVTWIFAVVWSLIFSAITSAIIIATSVTIIVPFLLSGFINYILLVSVYSMYAQAFKEIK